MAKSENKIQAVEMRKKGVPIREIARQLKVSKSSASIWCRDIKLSTTQLDNIKANALVKTSPGRLLGALMNKNKRENAISEFKLSGIKEVGKMSLRDMMLVGTALYWAEGAKTLG